MQTLTLRWKHGDHDHERALAQGESAVLGRQSDCDVVLPEDDRTIHRRHAEISWEGGAPRIRCIGRNGVRLDSRSRKLRQDESARLASTDRLRIGETEVLASVSRAAPGPRKLRCHHCGLIQDYVPEGMCSKCGFALAGGETVFIQE